jgi:hypothetical protein
MSRLFSPKQYLLLFFVLFFNAAFGQIFINEGSNRNYSTIADEDGEFKDWVELYNPRADTISLYNYSISDDTDNPTKWVFPNIKLAPGEYRTVFCSSKDRKPVTGFTNVLNTGTFNAVIGWNTHTVTTPIIWDGVSNLVINTCSYSSTGYTSNSEFKMSVTPFVSSVYAYEDGSTNACFSSYGTPSNLRPNMKINGHVVGTGNQQNCNTCYPAPYGNWYWGARNEMLILASELTAAGVTPGPINTIAFNVVGTDPNTIYDYIDFNLQLTTINSLSSQFIPQSSLNNQHTNFSLSGNGETVYLYSPNQTLISQLDINCVNLDNSTGCFPDSVQNIVLFNTATPNATNNNSAAYTDYLLPPVISVPSGFYSNPITVTLVNPNPVGLQSQIYFTLDGSDPSTSSTLYQGFPLTITSTKVLKARVFANGHLPSPQKVNSYFFGVSHVTPIISVITDNNNLYGPTGIFDNWAEDWQRPAYVEYFDSTASHAIVFTQNAGMQIDGGWGGSRYQPQHSFRLELANGVLGDGSINYEVIPGRPNRTKYSNFYLRNGSNQYLTLPYKDASQVKMMCDETNCYYTAWRPVSVYINGGYFGLYELREKIDDEYFKVHEDADSCDILSVSAFYGGVLRSVLGCVPDTFYNNTNSLNSLNVADTAWWTKADKYIDMQYYVDYIISESWMGNTDWPQNNIKIYRSEKTNRRWRFCTIDLELTMSPNGWTDCFSDHIDYMLNQDPNNPYIGPWLRGIQNGRFKNYFINRFADVMNTAYLNSRLQAVENYFYTQTVTEMPKEYERWGDPNNVPGQMNDFQNNHATFSSQLLQRTPVVRENILSNFDLPNTVNLTLNVHPAGAGKIHISTIEPTTYPWNGIYFNGVPIKIEAIANEGWVFNHWEDNSLIADTMLAVYNDTLDISVTNFDAYFVIDTTTGINNQAAKLSNFTLYPNPAKSTLMLRYNGTTPYANLSLQIADLTGRNILQQNMVNAATNTTVDISSLAGGVYVLRLYNGSENIQQFRFVKLAE